MTPLKRSKDEFWGQPCWVRPYLISKIFGDGKELIWFLYLDDRPDFYVARVNSGTLKAIEKQSDRWYDDIMPDIEESIADEAMDFYREIHWKEYDRDGYVSATRDWPIPPYNGSGTSWGAYTGPLIQRGGKKVSHVQ